jgi:putative ABC transport system permease protein
MGGDVFAIGRLRPGRGRDTAQAEMDAVMRGIGREHREDSGTGVLVRPLREHLVGDVRRPFLMLLGGVAFVLLIGCANIANLLLARATARQKEMAIRASLGAGRLRLARQTLVESIVLGTLGGACGIAIAIVAVRAVPGITTVDIPRVNEIAVDYRMLGAAAILSLASALLSGAVPAFRAGRQDLRTVLQQGDAPATGQAGGHRLRYTLVVVQLALALLLLCGAGLMANSLLRLMNIDLGFERANLIAVGPDLPYKRYDRRKSAEFYQRLADEVRRIDGVERATTSDFLPLMAVHFPYFVRREGGGAAEGLELQARHVGPGYLRVTGVSLLAGRDLEAADDGRQPVPVLINEAAARVLFPHENPIGRRLITNYRNRNLLEIVGVTGDAHQLGLTEQAGLQLYVPGRFGNTNYVVARTSPGAGDVAAAMRSAVHALDPSLPPAVILTADRFFALQTATPRFYLLLLGAFAASAILLMLIGVYGVLSYTIARRTHEFGVRIAMGAGRRDILGLVFGLGARLTSVGVALGVAGALILTRFLSTLLYEVQPGDPATLACAVVLLSAVVMVVCALAARRATRIDPMTALRCE